LVDKIWRRRKFLTPNTESDIGLTSAYYDCRCNIKKDI